MFILGHIREAPNRTGTRHVHFAFGKGRIYAVETVPHIPYQRRKKKIQRRIKLSQYNIHCYILEVNWYLQPVVLRIVIQVCCSPFTVQSLYEGLLVTSWTTARRTSQQRWSCLAQLAIVLVLFLAALTFVGRCYASSGSDATATPLVRFHPRPFNNSKRPTSNLVLDDRLFIPDRFVKSDTRIIRENSKVLSTKRTKRGFESPPAQGNRLAFFQTKSNYEQQQQQFHNSHNDIGLLSNSTFHNISSSSSNSSDSANVSNNYHKKNIDKTRVTVNDTVEFFHQKNGHFPTAADQENRFPKSTQRPMPPAHAHDKESSGAVSALGIVVLVILVTGTILGLVTCLVNHRWGTGGTTGPATPPTQPHQAANSPTTAPMLSVVSASSNAAAGMGGMERLRGGGGRAAAARDLAHARDRQTRLRAVHADIAIDLPHSIAMPDGEEHPFTQARLHLRDAEQESEIYQKCIRPPPNRTVLDSDSPPPYRSSSAGVLPSSSSTSSSSSSCSGSDWSSGSGPLVVRCHSMSSTSKPSSTASHHHHHHHHQHHIAAAAGQKTDFLQRTVKIFTGSKKTPAMTTATATPSTTTPVVIVPTSRSQSQQNKNSKQPPPAV